jgi:hypothetical protein
MHHRLGLTGSWAHGTPHPATKKESAMRTGTWG